MGKRMKLSRKVFIKLAVFWTVLIFILSVLSAKQINRLNVIDIFGIDKVGHILFYTMLSFFWSGVFYNARNGKFFIIFLCSSFGFLLEILQFYLFIGRSFELYDALANILGVLSGVLLFDKLTFKMN